MERNEYLERMKMCGGFFKDASIRLRGLPSLDKSSDNAVGRGRGRGASRPAKKRTEKDAPKDVDMADAQVEEAAADDDTQSVHSTVG